jgi:serine protease Do
MRRVTPAGGAFLGLLLLAGAARGQVGPESFASLAHFTLPAVVTITVPDVFDARPSDEDSRSAEFLYELFGGPLKGRRQAVGTGVILDADGLVITSAHAVAGAADIEAIVADGVSHKATVVGLDRKTDVAVLRLRGPGPFPHARLGDSDAARVGDWVLAVASPYGLGTTVTRGIISATPRARPRAGVDDLLQTDAATFLDSVGGPLVNARGEVIGFTTVLTLHDFGISFALPSNAAGKIVAQLAREGAVARGSLDVRFQGLSPGLSRALGLPDTAGLRAANAVDSKLSALFQPRIFTTVAGVLCGVGWATMGYATSLPMLYMLYVLAGVGAALPVHRPGVGVIAAADDAVVADDVVHLGIGGDDGELTDLTLVSHLILPQSTFESRP